MTQEELNLKFYEAAYSGVGKTMTCAITVVNADGLGPTAAVAGV